ncbi:MAG: Tad domain-containing protein [Candidatus Dormibacteria bacterium]
MRKSRPRQGGQVAVLFAVAAVAVIALVGLAIDAGQAFVDRSALQSGSDAAAVAGTQLLEANFVSEDQGGGVVYSDSQIQKAVDTTLNGSHAANSHVSSYTAYYTDYQGNLLSPPVAVGSLDGGNPPPAAQGVKVTAVDNQATLLLGVVGIGQSRPQATATAVTGPITGCTTDSNCVPFAAWSVECPSVTAWKVGDPVTYFKTKWSKETCPSALDTNSFKGHFNSAAPTPGSVVVCTGGADACDTPACASASDCPNDVATKSGIHFSSSTQNFLNSAWASPSHVIVVAVVSCDKCSGSAVFDVTGFLAIKMQAACRHSDQVAGCQGTVVASANSVAGLQIGKVNGGPDALALQLLT